MNDTKDPTARSDLPVRIAAGVAMAMAALIALWLRWPFMLLIAGASALMLIEWADMHRIERRWSLGGAALLVANLGLAMLLFRPTVAAMTHYWPWFASAVLLGILLGLARRNTVLGWGYVYVAIPAFALLILLGTGWEVVLWAMLVTWATDIFAFFAGRSIGGPKLATRISPNKTWAGLAGGAVGAAAVGFVAAVRFGLPPAFLWAGGGMALIAQAGDLYESAAKRRVGVKDSGTILPGHGGVLDRLDGLLPVAVATLLLWMTSR